MDRKELVFLVIMSLGIIFVVDMIVFKVSDALYSSSSSLEHLLEGA